MDNITEDDYIFNEEINSPNSTNIKSGLRHEQKKLGEQLNHFATWVGENKFRYDGFKFWRQGYSGDELIFSTEQIVQKFFKERGVLPL